MSNFLTKKEREFAFYHLLKFKYHFAEVSKFNKFYTSLHDASPSLVVFFEQYDSIFLLCNHFGVRVGKKFFAKKKQIPLDPFTKLHCDNKYSHGDIALIMAILSSKNALSFPELLSLKDHLSLAEKNTRDVKKKNIIALLKSEVQSRIDLHNEPPDAAESMLIPIIS